MDDILTKIERAKIMPPLFKEIRRVCGRGVEPFKACETRDGGPVTFVRLSSSNPSVSGKVNWAAVKKESCVVKCSVQPGRLHADP
jgi:hypothetical protein